MDVDDDLFWDVEVAQVTHSSASYGPDACAHEAWQLWSDLTERPDRSSPDREFLKTYRGWIKSNYRHEHLLDIVRGAALTKPRPRDPRDTRRVLMALNNPGHEATALALLAEDGRAAYPYPRERMELLTTIAELEALIGTTQEEWTGRDLEAAGLIVQEMDPKAIKTRAERVMLYLGSSTLMPVQLVQHGRAAEGSDHVRANAQRDAYDSGRTEAEALGGVLFVADIAAERMLVRGIANEDIVAYHNQAPQRYWLRVVELMDSDPGASYEEVYEVLRSEFAWHPQDRKRLGG